MPPYLKGSFNYCQYIHKQHGKSYFFATRFFSTELRQATWALYAWMRYADDIVDLAGGKDIFLVTAELDQWEEDWKQAYQTKTSDHPVLMASQYIFHRYNIPYSYSESFLRAMRQDLTKTRYATYEELEYYMYGSAGVVGLIMAHIVGYKDKYTLEKAKQNGYAMQLTNFLRDIKEDLLERNRIYFPQVELNRFNITEDDLRLGKMSKNMRSFIQFQSNRADKLYEQSWPAINDLGVSGRLPIRIASVLYRQILRKIDQQDLNVFSRRAHTSTLEKIISTVKIIMTYGRT